MCGMLIAVRKWTRKTIIKLILLFVVLQYLRELWTNSVMTERRTALMDKRRHNSNLIASEMLSANWEEIKAIMGTDKLTLTLNRKYILENKTLCSSSNKIQLVVIVHSAPKNFDKRELIRRTWMNPNYVSRYGTTRLLFILGRPLNASLQTDIDKESRYYGDILQGDFIDSYRNITNKAILAYKWLTERCQQTEFLLKVDDDVTVNIDNVYNRVIPYIHSKSRTVVCHKDDTAIFHRKQGDKQNVPGNLFPGHSACPKYCWGYFVLLTGDMIPLLYEAAKTTPFFHVDDVYVYGILMNRIPGIEYVSLKENSLESKKLGFIKAALPDSCLNLLWKITGYCRRALVAVGDLTADEMVTYWDLIH